MSVNNNSYLQPCSKGFTLLEVLVSVSMLSIILISLYAAYTSNVNAIQIARSNSRLNQTARIILELMRREIESAFITADYTDPGDGLGFHLRNKRIDGKSVDSLDFTTLASLSLPGSILTNDLCEVGYHLENDPEGQGWILFRRQDSSVDYDYTTGGNTQALASGVAGLDFILLDEDGREYEEWPADNLSLPILVKIRLHLVEAEGREQVFFSSTRPALASLRGE